MIRWHSLIVCALVCIVIAAVTLLAGELDAPAAPTSPGSAMYTLPDLYNRLMTGAAGSKRGGGFAEPVAGPTAGSMHTLDEIMGKAPAIDFNGASTGEVLAGKSYWGLTAGNWGPATGTMANVGSQNITPGLASQPITAGYHSGAGMVEGDASLVPANIRAGVTLFGVVGKSSVVDTSPATASPTDIILNRTAYANGELITGVRVGGVVLKAPGFFYEGKPRWFVNGNGTITDCKSGLVWLSDIDYTAHPYIASTGAPIDAMRYLFSLSHGNPPQLTDNSRPGDWDMPTLPELATLWEPDEYNQQIGSMTGKQAFDNTFYGSYYWTSTPVSVGGAVAAPDTVMVVNMMTGAYIEENKLALTAIGHYVWPIRRIHRW